jgi:hypothetical protein
MPNKILLDEDPMPFGKHKGEKMADVPADYFNWLWIETGKRYDFENDVACYIRRNLDALKQENPDLIWEK